MPFSLFNNNLLPDGKKGGGLGRTLERKLLGKGSVEMGTKKKEGFPVEKMGFSKSLSCAMTTFPKVIQAHLFCDAVEIARWIKLDAGKIKNGVARENILEPCRSVLRFMPVKLFRSVKMKAEVVAMDKSRKIVKRFKAQMAVDMVWFDIPGKPGWVPIFANLVYRSVFDQPYLNLGYSFEWEFLDCGYWFATPQRISNWGDCADD